jgi:hypothetical protein
MSSPAAAVARFARIDCTAAAFLAAGRHVVVAWTSRALLKRRTLCVMQHSTKMRRRANCLAAAIGMACSSETNADFPNGSQVAPMPLGRPNRRAGC